MGSSHSSAKKVTFERKGDSAIEVTQEAFDLMTGKKRPEDITNHENKPPKPEEPVAKPRKEKPKSPVASGDPNFAALTEAEERFQEKLRKLEASQKRNLEAEKAALESAVKELEVKLQHSVVASGGVCRDAQEAIIQCYRENPNKPLNCAKLVEQFSQCVSNERLRLLGSSSSKSSSEK